MSVLWKRTRERFQKDLENEDQLIQCTQEALQLLNELHHFIHLSPEYVNLHRWQYANAPHQTSKIFVFDKQQHLAACGDWSIGARVENAFLASYELFIKFKDILFEI
jgi:predicted NAD/FAD-dependent oxidoreductase